MIDFDRQEAKDIDSIRMLSHRNMMIDSNLISFYYCIIKYCYNSAKFKSNDATFQQLKNSGNYSLIEMDHIFDSLTKYNRDIQNVFVQWDYYEANFKEILSRLDDLIDVAVLGDTNFISQGKLRNRSFPQLRTEKEKLTTFLNKIFVFKIITSSYTENNLLPT